MSTTRVASAVSEAIRFLEALEPGASSWSFQTFDDTPGKRPELAGTRHGTLMQHADWLTAQNVQGAGVFVTVNETDGKGRKASNVIRVRALFADFDNPEPDALERLRADPLPPSIIVESSTGKWHAYWLIEGLALADFKPLQQRIAEHWGSDPKVCDLPRVMRLPGFQHCKGDPHSVRLVEVAGKRYGLELAARYAPLAPEKNALQGGENANAEEVGGYAAVALERACKAVESAVEGSRNDTLNREAFGLTKLMAGGKLSETQVHDRLHAAALRAGLESCEVMRTLKSAFEAGAIHPRTVPESSDVKSMRALEPAAPQEMVKPYEPVLRWVDLSGLMTAEIPPQEFLFEPLFPRRHVSLLGAHGGTGKSSLAVVLAAHTACGRGWAGFPSVRARALIVSLEDEGEICQRRLRDVVKAYKLEAQAVIQRVAVLDGTSGNSALMAECDGRAMSTPVMDELKAIAHNFDLILIDNASDAFDANENSRRDVRAFIRELAGIARQHNAAVVLLSHIDKASAKGAASGNSYSGSTAWHNSARSRLAMCADVNGVVTLVHEKANLSSKADAVCLIFNEDRVLMPTDMASNSTNPAHLLVADADAVYKILKIAIEAGIDVPTATRGPATTWHALEPFPELGEQFRSKEGKKRLAAAVTRLMRERRIVKESYKKGNRHEGERWMLADETGAADAAGTLKVVDKMCADISPIPPGETGARLGACADAQVIHKAETGETSETSAATLPVHWLSLLSSPRWGQLSAFCMPLRAHRRIGLLPTRLAAV